MMKELAGKLKWLDPFTYVDLYLMPLVNPRGDKAIESIVYVISAFVFAYVLYNFVLAYALGTSSPLVIVYSGSMEPTLYRGDVVILGAAASLSPSEAVVDFTAGDKALRDYAKIGYQADAIGGQRPATLLINGKEFSLDPKGPIVVYTSPTRWQDIIHRAVLKLKAPDGEFLVTLGDNNERLDQDCGESEINRRVCISPRPVPIASLKGKYLFHLPLLGYVKLLFFDDLPRLLFPASPA